MNWNAMLLPEWVLLLDKRRNTLLTDLLLQKIVYFKLPEYQDKMLSVRPQPSGFGRFEPW